MDSLNQEMKKALHWIGDHTLGHVVSGPIVYVLLVLAKAGYQMAGGEVAAIYVLANPGLTAVAFFTAGVVITTMYRVYGFLKAYLRNREILASAGLSGFWKHATSSEKERNWASCKKQIGSHMSADIRILGVTGWDTFGRHGTPLHDVLRMHKGEIKILLIKPRCKSFIQRARSLNVNEDEYEKDISKSLEFCKELRDTGKLIWVKLYQQTPIWKMIFTNQYLWLQYYKPDDHVDNTPIYTFFADKEKTSLFYPLTDVFSKRWYVDENEVVVQPGHN